MPPQIQRGQEYYIKNKDAFGLHTRKKILFKDRKALLARIFNIVSRVYFAPLKNLSYMGYTFSQQSFMSL